MLLDGDDALRLVGDQSRSGDVGRHRIKQIQRGEAAQEMRLEANALLAVSAR